MSLQRKLEVCAAGIVLILAIVFLVGYIRERENRAAFEAEAKVREQAQKDSEKAIEKIRSDMQAQLEALSRQKQAVIQQPQQAPQVIREYVPFSQPLQQTAPITKETPPDAPSAILTKQQEVELAQFAVSCKQCDVERESLKSQMAEKDKIIKSQKEELDAAKKTVKGGGKFQRFKTAAKWIVIGAGAGYVLGKR